VSLLKSKICGQVDDREILKGLDLAMDRARCTPSWSERSGKSTLAMYCPESRATSNRGEVRFEGADLLNSRRDERAGAAFSWHSNIR